MLLPEHAPGGPAQTYVVAPLSIPGTMTWEMALWEELPDVHLGPALGMQIGLGF